MIGFCEALGRHGFALCFLHLTWFLSSSYLLLMWKFECKRLVCRNTFLLLSLQTVSLMIVLLTLKTGIKQRHVKLRNLWTQGRLKREKGSTDIKGTLGKDPICLRASYRMFVNGTLAMQISSTLMILFPFVEWLVPQKQRVWTCAVSVMSSTYACAHVAEFGGQVASSIDEYWAVLSYHMSLTGYGFAQVSLQNAHGHQIDYSINCAIACVIYQVLLPSNRPTKLRLG